MYKVDEVYSEAYLKYMTQERDIDPINSVSLLKDTAQDLYALARKHQHESLVLLALLRDLEQIHRQIRTEYFESALPQTRNDLYQFVKDIEEKGGWPYVERMRLRDLLNNLEFDEVQVHAQVIKAEKPKQPTQTEEV